MQNQIGANKLANHKTSLRQRSDSPPGLNSPAKRVGGDSRVHSPQQETDAQRGVINRPVKRTVNKGAIR
jgi:hypothetical protein